jgi:hypothetical protein
MGGPVGQWVAPIRRTGDIGQPEGPNLPSRSPTFPSPHRRTPSSNVEPIYYGGRHLGRGHIAKFEFRKIEIVIFAAAAYYFLINGNGLVAFIIKLVFKFTNITFYFMLL